MSDFTQNLDLIDLVVLTFIGYKQKDRHQDKQTSQIYT